MLKTSKIELLLDNMKIVLFSIIATVGFYIYSYLRYGELEVSIIDVLSWFGNEWASDPNDWIGVHKILDMAPIYSLIIIGIILTIIFWFEDIDVENEMVEEERKKKLSKKVKEIKGVE